MSDKNNKDADILSHLYLIVPGIKETDRHKQTQITKINDSMGKLQGISQNQAEECDKYLLLKEHHYILIHSRKNQVPNTFNLT